MVVLLGVIARSVPQASDVFAYLLGVSQDRDRLRVEVLESRREIEARSRQLALADQRINHLEQRRDQSELELRLAKQELASLRSKLTMNEDDIKSREQALQELRSQITSLVARAERAENDVAEARAELQRNRTQARRTPQAPAAKPSADIPTFSIDIVSLEQGSVTFSIRNTSELKPEIALGSTVLVTRTGEIRVSHGIGPVRNANTSGLSDADMCRRNLYFLPPGAVVRSAFRLEQLTGAQGVMEHLDVAVTGFVCGTFEDKNFVFRFDVPMKSVRLTR